MTPRLGTEEQAVEPPSNFPLSPPLDLQRILRILTMHDSIFAATKLFLI